MRSFRPESRTLAGWLVVLGVIVASSASLRAAVITQTPHGSFTGTTVTYENILETREGPALFGPPTLMQDDTLVFTPTDFTSEPTLPSLTEIIDSQLRFTIHALPNETVSQLFLEEEGVVTLTGPLTDFAMATVAMPLFFHILEIDGVAVNGPSGDANMVFSPSDGMFELANGELNNATWTGSLLLDFDQIILNDPNFSGSATKVEVTFNNTLSTANFGTSFASITKNSLKIAVPEASSLLLGLVGMTLCVSRWTLHRYRRMR